MSNKWAELYGGHHEHNERQYYSSIGISDIYAYPSSDKFMDRLTDEEGNYDPSKMDADEDGFNHWGIKVDYRKEQEEKDIKGAIILFAFVALVLILGG